MPVRVPSFDDEVGRRGKDELPILLGEAPSKSGDRYHMFPLSGAVAQTLCTLAGIPPQEEGSRYGRWTWALYEHFDCGNLIERWPGAQGSGSAFPLDVARPLAIKTLEQFQQRVVVVLGSRLAGLFSVNFYEWSDHAVVTRPHPGGLLRCECQIIAIPHPSGLNRTLNDPSQRQRAGDALKEAMRRATHDRIFDA